jgi:hypothetical protein
MRSSFDHRDYGWASSQDRGALGGSQPPSVGSHGYATKRLQAFYER